MVDILTWVKVVGLVEFVLSPMALQVGASAIQDKIGIIFICCFMLFHIYEDIPRFIAFHASMLQVGKRKKKPNASAGTTSNGGPVH